MHRQAGVQGGVDGWSWRGLANFKTPHFAGCKSVGLLCVVCVLGGDKRHVGM